MPAGNQQHQMRRFAGSCRFVFNNALALQKEHHEDRLRKAQQAMSRKQKFSSNWRRAKARIPHIWRGAKHSPSGVFYEYQSQNSTRLCYCFFCTGRLYFAKKVFSGCVFSQSYLSGHRGAEYAASVKAQR
jgi:hypothetical protein